MQRCLLALLLATAIGVPLTAQTIPTSEFRGSAATIVVYYRSNNDPRPFELNLALAETWIDFETRDIAVLDAGPGRFDSDALARQFDLAPDTSFAAILVNRVGEPLFATNRSDALDELLDAYDERIEQ